MSYSSTTFLNYSICHKVTRSGSRIESCILELRQVIVIIKMIFAVFLILKISCIISVSQSSDSTPKGNNSFLYFLCFFLEESLCFLLLILLSLLILLLLLLLHLSLLCFISFDFFFTIFGFLVLLLHKIITQHRIRLFV